MDLRELRGERARRQRSRRRRSAVIAAACAGAMLALTAGVFTVASTSRRVAEESSRVHLLDEILTSTTIARAQLGFGIVLADLDSFSDVDAGDAVRTSEDDIDSTLESIGRTRLLLDAQSQGLGDSTNSALDAFEQAVIGNLPLTTSLDSGNVADDLEAVYTDATTLLVTEREEAIEAVEEADQSLGRLSTLVSFLTAFVIPTLAIIIYRLLAAPQRELLEAQARASRDTALVEIRRSLLLKHLELLHELADAPTDFAEPQRALADRIDGVRRMILTLERAQRCDFHDVDLTETLRRAAANSRSLEVRQHGDHAPAVLSDADVLELLLASVLADCRHRGATTVDVETETSDSIVSVFVRHDGVPRSPSECRVITTQATVAERLALLGGPDVDIVAAMHLTEDLQGRLQLDQDSGAGQVLALHLPRGPSSLGRQQAKQAASTS